MDVQVAFRRADFFLLPSMMKVISFSLGRVSAPIASKVLFNV